MGKKIVLGMAGVAVLAGMSAWATNRDADPSERLEEHAEIGQALDAPSRHEQYGENEIARMRVLQAKTEALDVGDSETFGKSVKWLGFMSSPRVLFKTDCSTVSGSLLCHQVYPDSGGGSSAFVDVARVTLPARSIESMLCHWQSPNIDVFFQNKTEYQNLPVFVHLFPTITVESAALEGVGPIDPDSGEPLNGKLTLHMPSADVDATLNPTERLSQRSHTTRACIAGLLTHATLREYWGLTDAQVRQFYRSPVTLRLNMYAISQGVTTGSYQVSYRFVGR